LTARDVFIIVLSPESVVSRWVRRELDTAINEGKRIVPVLYQPCEVRADLKIIQIISFLSPKSYETAFNELLKALGLPEQPIEVVTQPGQPAVTTEPIMLPGQSSLPLEEGIAESQAPLPTNVALPSKPSDVPDDTMTPPMAPKPKRGISRIQASLLVGLALLVIAGGIGLSFVLRSNQSNNTFSDTTATANAQITATSQDSAGSIATIIAQVNANATATAFAPTQTAASGASQNPYPPHLWTLALNDPLRDNAQGYGWDENANCVFTGGIYHVGGSGQNTNACFAKSTNYSNFTFQVQMNIINGGCGGLVFRADNTSFKLYTFVVCTDGTYGLLSYTSAGGTWLINPTSFAAIHTNLNQANVLAVVASGNKFDLYVNLEHITSVNDSTYNHGQIGVVAVVVGQGDQSGVEVAFSNAKVWTS
jgi:hypothetical protein